MRQRHRSIPFLLLSILTLGTLIPLIYFFPPDYQVSFLNFQLSILALFFPLLFIFLFALGSYLFKNRAHGILVALLITSCLLFLLNDLRHPFFFVMLFALFLTLELFVSYRR